MLSSSFEILWLRGLRSEIQVRLKLSIMVKLVVMAGWVVVKDVIIGAVGSGEIAFLRNHCRMVGSQMTSKPL